MSTSRQAGASSSAALYDPIPSPSYPAMASMAAPVFWREALRDNDTRQCVRRSIRCDMYLIDDVDREEESTAAQVIPAECLNISDSGLYGVVPIGYGVAMGQRYTFRLTIGERGPDPGANQLVSQVGTVIRTELLIGADGSGDRVGIGVRLHGHRSGTVPMPSMPA